MTLHAAWVVRHSALLARAVQLRHSVLDVAWRAPHAFAEQGKGESPARVRAHQNVLLTGEGHRGLSSTTHLGHGSKHLLLALAEDALCRQGGQLLLGLVL